MKRLTTVVDQRQLSSFYPLIHSAGPGSRKSRIDSKHLDQNKEGKENEGDNTDQTDDEGARIMRPTGPSHIYIVTY